MKIEIHVKAKFVFINLIFFRPFSSRLPEPPYEIKSKLNFHSLLYSIDPSLKFYISRRKSSRRKTNNNKGCAKIDSAPSKTHMKVSDLFILSNFP